jgi:predicted dehydrogenase
MGLKVAIVGLGKAGRNIHLPALRKLPQLEIIGGYDAAASATDVGIPKFESVDALLAAKPDLLVVATPPSSHAELTAMGLKAGCHVFGEKPLAETLPQALALADLAKAQGRQVIINSEFPFMPIHWEAKQRMARPGFGRLQFISMHQTFLVTADTEEGWRGVDPRRTLKEFGTHVLDLAKHFFDERPISLRARMPRPAGAGTPDYLNILELEFSGDRFAHIMLDRLSRGRHRYLDIRLDGTEATIETSIGGRLQVKAGIQPKGRKPFVDIDVAMGGRARLYKGDAYEKLATAPIDLFADATARLLERSLPALESGAPAPYSLDEAIHTLRMLLACYETPDGEKIACDRW